MTRPAGDPDYYIPIWRKDGALVDAMGDWVENDAPHAVSELAAIPASRVTVTPLDAPHLPVLRGTGLPPVPPSALP